MSPPCLVSTNEAHACQGCSVLCMHVCCANAHVYCVCVLCVCTCMLYVCTCVLCAWGFRMEIRALHLVLTTTLGDRFGKRGCLHFLSVLGGEVALC